MDLARRVYTRELKIAVMREYDALDREAQVSFGNAESTVSYSYDAAGRLVRAVDSASGTIALSYDGLDRLIQESTAQGTVAYTYDNAGRRTTMSVSGQTTVNYLYDNADRLTQIMQGLSSVAFTYDSAGRRASVTLPNGVVTNYSYDAASQLTAISYGPGGTLGNLTYAYDLAGRRTVVGGSFARTGLPDTGATGAYNINNQLTQWASRSLSYDANGNVTSDGVVFAIPRVNMCSGAYKTGEYAEIGAEVVLTLGSLALKAAAARTARTAVRAAAEPFVRGIREEGKLVHHINPLYGHPGARWWTRSALFPTAGLPAWIHSSRLNLVVLSRSRSSSDYSGRDCWEDDGEPCDDKREVCGQCRPL